MAERIWIYVISKELNTDQLNQLSANSTAFVNSWTAHDVKLAASFEIYKHKMLVMKVDESAYNASGCSIDKLQRFIKEQELAFGIELLNRLLVAYESNGDVKITHSSKISELLKAGEINENTLVFDNTISSSTQLPEWKKPLKATWLNKYLSNSVA